MLLTKIISPFLFCLTFGVQLQAIQATKPIIKKNIAVKAPTKAIDPKADISLQSESKPSPMMATATSTVICETCKKVNELLSKQNQKNFVDISAAFLNGFRFSSNRVDEEVALIMKLAIVILPKDETGNATEAIYDIYNEQKPKFDELLKKQKPTDQEEFKKMIRENDTISDKGNG